MKITKSQLRQINKEEIPRYSEENLYDFAKPLGKKFINDLKNKVFNMEVNASNYEDCMNKIEEMCHELKSAKGE